MFTTGAIVGIVVAVAVGGCCVGAVAFHGFRRLRRGAAYNTDAVGPPPGNIPEHILAKARGPQFEQTTNRTEERARCLP